MVWLCLQLENEDKGVLFIFLTNNQQDDEVEVCVFVKKKNYYNKLWENMNCHLKICVRAFLKVVEKNEIVVW